MDRILTSGAIPDVQMPARQIFDQGEVDACFSCAIATVLEARSPEVPRLSPSFHLFYAYGGSPAVGGMSLVTARSVQTQYGICRLALYPFDVSKGTPNKAPQETAITDAGARRTRPDPQTGELTFRRLSNLNRSWEWRNALAAGLPVLVRIWLNPGYWALRDAALDTEAEWMDESNPGDASHAVVVIGYEAAKRRFIVQDSRGTTFAHGGQWFLPAGMTESRVIEDAYVLEVPLQNLL
jgi:hypothetical protein